MKLLLVPIDEINPYDGGHFKTKEEWEKIGPGLKDYEYHQQGIQLVLEGLKNKLKVRPIAIRERVNDYYDMQRKYERLDGYKRYTAQKEFGRTHIACVFYEKGDIVSPGCQDGKSFFID